MNSTEFLARPHRALCFLGTAKFIANDDRTVTIAQRGYTHRFCPSSLLLPGRIIASRGMLMSSLELSIGDETLRLRCLSREHVSDAIHWLTIAGMDSISPTVATTMQRIWDLLFAESPSRGHIHDAVQLARDTAMLYANVDLECLEALDETGGFALIRKVASWHEVDQYRFYQSLLEEPASLANELKRARA